MSDFNINRLDGPPSVFAMRDAKREIERLRDALKFIASQEQYTFAECSLAEKIIGRAKAALGR